MPVTIASAGRLVKNALIAAKVEATQGTDVLAGSPASADILKVSNFSVNPISSIFADRGQLRPTFGEFGKIFAGGSIEVSFDVELGGGGAAGTAPGYDMLLKGCGLAATINAASNVTYNPITTSQSSLTIYYYDSGQLHKLVAAKGNIDKITMNAGETPKASFKFIGVDAGIAATAIPATAPAATWVAPLGLNDTNSGDFTLGATYTLATGVIASGTAYACSALELSLGNEVQFVQLLGQEVVDIVGRAVSGSVTLDLTPAQEVTFMTALKANTTQSMVLSHGTTAGNKFQVYAPLIQWTGMSKAEKNGRRLMTLPFVCQQNAGNDDLYLAAL